MVETRTCQEVAKILHARPNNHYKKALRKVGRWDTRLLT